MVFVWTSSGSCLGQCKRTRRACPHLFYPHLLGNIQVVSNVTELHQAINGIAANTTVLLEPGDYVLNSTLWIQQDNITIRGNSDRCDQVILIGRGMEKC